MDLILPHATTTTVTPTKAGVQERHASQTASRSRIGHDAHLRLPAFAGMTAILMTLAACKPADAPKADAPKTAQAGGPPPPPPYQMRSEMPSGDRLSGGKDGADLFSNRCGSCHLAGGMGSNLLTKQRMAMGEPPENGLLANRKDLTPDYVKTVVRMGKNAMPAQTKVDITDAELEAVAAYLGKAKS